MSNQVPNDQSFWIELAALKHNGQQKQMVRNHFVPDNEPEAVEDWRKRHGNCDVFKSICRFSEPSRQSDYVCDFFLDIDADELFAARRQALRCCDLLGHRLGIEPASIDLSFSGARGFHVVVSRLVFGNPAGPRVMQIWHRLAARLAKEKLNHIDLGVYQTSRLLRLPNSINTKTGVHKIPLEYEELLDLGLEFVCESAREPREDDSMAMPTESPKAIGWWLKADEWFSQRSQQPRRPMRRGVITRRGWRYPQCVRRLEQATLPDGIRHNTYFTLARFYALIGMAPEEVAERLHSIDQRNPIRDSDYILRTAQCARKYKGFTGCPNEALGRFCDPGICFLTKDALEGNHR